MTLINCASPSFRWQKECMNFLNLGRGRAVNTAGELGRARGGGVMPGTADIARLKSTRADSTLRSGLEPGKSPSTQS